MMARLFLAVSVAAAAVPAAVGGLVLASGVAEARRCQMINIGTPSRPRLVKDPGCSTGR